MVRLNLATLLCRANLKWLFHDAACPERSPDHVMHKVHLDNDLIPKVIRHLGRRPRHAQVGTLLQGPA